MSLATTVLHIQGRSPDEVEAALVRVFADEGRAQASRLQGAFSAVLARALDAEESSGYSYLICPPHAGANWTTALEMGSRADGLEGALSAALDGCAVLSLFTLGDGLSGYRLARGGVEVDHYLSDPDLFASMATEQEAADFQPPSDGTAAIEAARGHPERFADLLPIGTRPQDFSRVVLAPGWWEAQGMAGEPPAAASEEDGEDEVDEEDRMRCIGLALEVWGPTEYPFAGDLEDIDQRAVSPTIALTFA